MGFSSLGVYLFSSFEFLVVVIYKNSFVGGFVMCFMRRVLILYGVFFVFIF